MRKLWIILLLGMLMQRGETFAKYEAGSIGVSTRFMGTHNISAPKNSKYKDFGYSLTLLEFFPQQRKGLLGYSSYIQIRFAIPFQKDQRIGSFINEFRWGFLFGGSSRLINTVKEDTGKGWGFFLNGGMTIDLPSVKRLERLTFNLIDTPVNLGAELSLKAVYNFHKYAAISIGFTFGYVMSVSYIDTGKTINSGIPGLDIPDVFNDTYFSQAIVYGFSIGFLF